MNKKRLLQFSWLMEEDHWSLTNLDDEQILIVEDKDKWYLSADSDYFGMMICERSIDTALPTNSAVELALLIEEVLASQPDCLGFMAYSSCGARKNC